MAIVQMSSVNAADVDLAGKFILQDFEGFWNGPYYVRCYTHLVHKSFVLADSHQKDGSIVDFGSMRVDYIAFACDTKEETEMLLDLQTRREAALALERANVKRQFDIQLSEMLKQHA